MAYKPTDLVSTKELAGWLDCSEQHVRDMAGQGILEKSEKMGKWDLKLNVIRHQRFLKTKRTAAQDTMEDLQRRHLEAKVNSAEQAFELEKGNLYTAKLVHELYDDGVRAARDTALAIPNKIAQMLADETGRPVVKVFKILTEEIENMLEKMATPKVTLRVAANVQSGRHVYADSETVGDNRNSG